MYIDDDNTPIKPIMIILPHIFFRSQSPSFTPPPFFFACQRSVLYVDDENTPTPLW